MGVILRLNFLLWRSDCN